MPPTPSRLVRLPVLALAVVLLLAAPPADAQDSAVRGSFGEETSVVLVEVPVTVVRDGKPVRGLTRDNFRLFEGRKRLDVVDFEVLDLATLGEQESRALPKAARRHFLLLFDLSLSEASSIVRARRAAQELVLAGLHPTDLVAVATYTLSRGPQLVLGFTSDRRQIDLAIESLGLPELAGLQPAPDPLGLLYSAKTTGRLDQAAANEPSRPGAGGDLSAIANAHEEEVIRRAQNTETADRRNRVIGLSRSMADLGKLLASVEGKKHVVYLSEGFDNSLLFGSSDFAVQEEQAIAAMRGQYQDVDSDTRFGSSRLQGDVDRMLEEFQKADATIQAVDIGGLRSESSAAGPVRAASDQGLFYFANETGGELYQNFNDLTEAMGQMLERSSVTYLLTFRPEDVDFDGEFRRLRVELEDVPRGTRAVHRPGYYEPVPYAELSGMAKRFQTADALLSGAPGGDFLTATLAVPFVAPGDQYVPVLVEIDGESFLRGAPEGVVAAEIYAYALDANGGVTDYFSQTVGVDTGKIGDTLRQGGLKYFGHLNLPAGDYTLRVFVRNQSTGAGALTVSDLAVPSEAVAGPVLLPALFPDTTNRWVLSREPEGEQRADVGFPFLLKEGAYLPEALPVLATGEAAPVQLIAYNMNPSALELQVQVERPDGTAVEGGHLQVSDRFRVEGEDNDRLVGSFEPRDLAPGDYRLRVTVVDRESGESHTSRSPFRVAGAG